ncbi:hypothetical protein CB0940_12255 [Cercospora beticola]|uniref:Uncharacterized protein n=1 Tax=Cercospora beticola TaxID=122368 RepID=A0A2G5IG25_CERBT|nr:hypothetical protein CB0940_12255 [Cercospora beticola]PIB03474.1 hypothetical protein CB0940_12255 [Cercospora beticola]WPA97218.1 hypothetical protein RHO25_001827 [Cercospora beticola]CAK1354371.1 unnamed protein product [Cercospora beticola]
MEQSVWADSKVAENDAQESTSAFAQTGSQQDDLFDDVVPVPEQESMRLRSDDDLFSEDFTPVPQAQVEPAKPSPPDARPTEAPATRGRGRGRGRGSREGKDGQTRNTPQTRGRDNTGPRARRTDDAGTSSTTSQPQTQTQNQAPENAPAGPRRGGARAVRGDRQDTGGVRRPKLTEEELAEKMARIQIKNASLTAAHARAEADAASFAEREQQAKKVAEERRSQEKRDRQQMMGEREKNRMRKLKAMEGREWDAEKQEQDFAKGSKFDKPGAFAGDQKDYSDGREYLYREPRGSHRGGRGGNRSQPATQTVPTKEEFPALAPQKDTKTAASKGDVTSAAGEATKGSWAEQVESSIGS